MPLEARLTTARAATIASGLALALYVPTMNRSIGFIDKGELLATASTLGIPHPTGYPTTMLVAYLFTRLVPIRRVLALNLMSALLVAASAAALTFLFDELMQRVGPRPDHKDRKDVESLEPSLRRILAGAAALGIALTGTWWGQGNGFEVYSLHALFLPLVVMAFLRFVDAGKEGEPMITRRGSAFALLVGLSFTNHLTTVLIAPGLLAYYVMAAPAGKMAAWLKRLVGLAPAFLLGLLPYAWLPLRARMRPWFNWGNPSTLEAFWNHVKGRQYSVWFGDWSVFGAQTEFFFTKLPFELGLIGLVLAIVGALLAARRAKKECVMAVLFVVACAIWSGSYSILEIAPYYMTAIFGLGILAGLGLVRAFEVFGRRGSLVTAALLVGLTAAFNYEESDESPNTYVEDMTRNVLGALPQGSVIYSSLWDFWVAGSFYLQKVEGVRPDVLVIDTELVRRSWYLDQLEYNQPSFASALKPEIVEFRKQLYKFEHDLPYDPSEIDQAYFGLLNAMIDRHIDERPAFVTSDVSPRVGERYFRTPQGLALRLWQDPKTYLPEDFPSYTFRPWRGHVDYYVAKTHELYATALFERGRYEKANGHESLAMRYLDYAISLDPGFDLEHLPSLPMGSESSVKGAATFFGRLRALKAR